MRSLMLLLTLLMLSAISTAQKKYLVSPRDEVMPLRRGESAASVIARQNARHTSSSSAACGPSFIFGYPENKFIPNSTFYAHHKDVMGEWFVAKATGSIDTIFWEAGGYVSAKDSFLLMRVHRSLIGPTYGPGVRPGPWNPPCQNWGYWVSTSDLDQGVAAFIEDASDTTWISTIAAGPKTGKPFDNTLWGFTGYPVIDHANQVNKVAMLELGTPLNVTIGDLFFLSQRVNGPAGHVDDAAQVTAFAATGFHVTADDENYPSRDWKFYEHDSGPSNCAGVPVNLVKRGWVARGGFTDDTLDVGVYNYWYSMTVSTNVPPDVVHTEVVRSLTFDQEDQLIQSSVIDCNPADPTSAGLKGVMLKWQLNGVPQPDIVMAPIGGDTYEATIPGQPPGNTVNYKVAACDSQDSWGSGGPIAYRVVQLSNVYYAVDTGYSCTPKSIAATGTVIPKSALFEPPGIDVALGPDDGTWGPIDLGSEIPFFGDRKRFAWIGVDGALALSKGISDTIDLNWKGIYTRTWSLPEQPIRQSDRSDTNQFGMIPNGFIAPLWADLWYGDSTTTCGAIRYQLGYGGDTCVMVVEWDSIGAWQELGGSACDVTTFRVCLNKCDGTIEFQYDDVGGYGADSNAVVGLQDSNAFTPSKPGYVFVHEYALPQQSRPRNGWCVKFYPATVVNALSGWNLLSVGVIPRGGYSTSNIFPGTVAPVYEYRGSYQPVTMTVNGPGYWAKFPSGKGIVGGRGSLVTSVEDSVVGGWNLIGAAGCPVATGAIVEAPPSIVSSNYFEYGMYGYGIVSSLQPGKGHWVKTSSPGKLSICNGNVPGKKGGSTNLEELNSITVKDASGRRQKLYLGREPMVAEPLSLFELPPPAPEFDARFTSGRILETYPAELDARACYEYPVTFEGSYPFEISWNISDEKCQLVLRVGSENTVMSGAGHVTLRDASVRGAVIRVTAAGAVPKEFALGQNYPNPFNPSTMFELRVAKTGLISLKIYDLLGKLVTTLVEETRDPGIYSVTWDAADFPTGVYFAKMVAGEFRVSRKVMLIK